MRFLIVLASVVAICAASTLSKQQLNPLEQRLMQFANENGDIELFNEPGSRAEIAPFFVVSWQARRMIHKMQKEMACGWPDLGIPPLAPLRISGANLDFKRGIFETISHVFRLKVAGLDNFEINTFKLNVIKSKLTFNFLFKNVDITAQKYETDTVIDALRQLGLFVEYEGDGSLLVGLINLRVSGVLKYKLPVLWGSAKILSLKTNIALGGVSSEIDGIMGNGKINHAINSQVENLLVKGVNSNQQAISDTIEDSVVLPVNKFLKGKDFWTLIDLIFSGSESEGEGENENDPIVVDCVPPADPWA